MSGRAFLAIVVLMLLLSALNVMFGWFGPQ